MSERSELRRRREERMENGVKNLKGARLFPKTFLRLAVLSPDLLLFKLDDLPGELSCPLSSV